jgi:single-stranded-DNA-specific exonuclease
MPPLTKRWQVQSPITLEADQGLNAYPPVLRKILFNRGFTTSETARSFLEAVEPPGTDPYQLLGMAETIDRLEHALQRREKIAIYGDYDADGVTATALLVEVLREFEGDVSGYIPNRFDEGYGLNIEALDYLHSCGVSVVLTVDCGVRSLVEAEHARKLGLDLIISDHHHPGNELPVARAVINPKQPADPYPDKDLAGVGLAYKIACALYARVPGKSTGQAGLQAAKAYLDLVALGTVADLAPLIGENRSMVRAGLKLIRQPRRQGLLSLIGVSGLKPNRITATDIGFVIGPRLNAAGRLDSALAAFDLLTTPDVNEAGRLAQKLETQNHERQKLMREIQLAAEELALAQDPGALLLFASHKDFNPGVVGLAASRLSDLYYRPAIVAQIGEEFTRGSCRSIREFHITEALDECSELLEHHGGHAAAAGFTIRNENLPAFVEKLQGIASNRLANLDLRPTLVADEELPLRDLTPDLLNYLEWLQPTGYGNPGALFVSRDLKVNRPKPVGKDGAHLKMVVSDGWISFDAIAFRQGHWIEKMPSSIDLLYSFELNEYNGRQSLQLNVRDLKPAGTPD